MSAQVMNWRRGLFRVWLVVSALWVLGCSLIMFMWSDNIAREVNLALTSNSNKELLSLWCTSELGIPPLPEGFVLEEGVFLEKCAKKDPKLREAWAAGDSFSKQLFRVAEVLLPPLALVLVPPLFVLVLGASIGWALLGFRKPNSVQ